MCCKKLYFHFKSAIKAMWPTPSPHSNRPETQTHVSTPMPSAHSNDLSPSFIAPAMKLLSVLSAVIAVAFFQTAAGFKCSSGCAACWKIGVPGEDIKMTCDQDNDCGGVRDCPPGYDSPHCAKTERCMWVDLSTDGNQYLTDHSQIDVRIPIVTSLARVFAEQSTALASRRTAKLNILTSTGADSGGPFSGFKSTIPCWLNIYIFQYILHTTWQHQVCSVPRSIVQFCESVKSVNSRRNSEVIPSPSLGKSLGTFKPAFARPTKSKKDR